MTKLVAEAKAALKEAERYDKLSWSTPEIGERKECRQRAIYFAQRAQALALTAILEKLIKK